MRPSCVQLASTRQLCRSCCCASLPPCHPVPCKTLSSVDCFHVYQHCIQVNPHRWRGAGTRRRQCLLQQWCRWQRRLAAVAQPHSPVATCALLMLPKAVTNVCKRASALPTLQAAPEMRQQAGQACGVFACTCPCTLPLEHGISKNRLPISATAAKRCQTPRVPPAALTGSRCAAQFPRWGLPEPFRPGLQVSVQPGGCSPGTQACWMAPCSLGAARGALGQAIRQQ